MDSGHRERGKEGDEGKMIRYKMVREGVLDG